MLPTAVVEAIAPPALVVVGAEQSRPVAVAVEAEQPFSHDDSILTDTIAEWRGQR